MNLFREPWHLFVLLVLLVLLFGWKRLPDMARSVGRSMRIFKSEMSEMKNDGSAAKPAPAASDTVPGDVVPPASTAGQPGAASATGAAPTAQPASAPQPERRDGPAS
ncbi:MAG: Sec-independent protein translocase subunit TatA [Dermatophilaceae bacterium]